VSIESDHTTTIPMLSLTEDTLVEVGMDDSLVVVTRWGEFELAGTDELTVESLRRLALGTVCVQNVPGDVADTAGLRRVLEALSGSVVHSLGLPDGKRPLLSVVPVGRRPRFDPRPVAPDTPIRLSRFAAMRPADGLMVLECPSSRFRVQLGRPDAVRVAGALATPTSPAEVATETGLAASLVADMVSYLVGAGVALTGDKAGFAEDTDVNLRQWAPHELLFHVRSRTRLGRGRSEAPSRSSLSNAAVSKPVPAGPRLPLYRPAANAPGPQVALSGLLEIDHVCPAFADLDVTADQLGELLYRSARIRSVGPSPLPINGMQLASQRPYYSVACLYELELYLTVNRCAPAGRIPVGIYHYDPQGHALTLVNDEPSDVVAVLDMAMAASGTDKRPAALLTATTRQERTSWALGGASYATALMHLGALQQTLYLTARTLGLAAHAITVDADDRVEAALRLRWPGEAAIGECVIGPLLRADERA